MWFFVGGLLISITIVIIIFRICKVEEMKAGGTIIQGRKVNYQEIIGRPNLYRVSVEYDMNGKTFTQTITTTDSHARRLEKEHDISLLYVEQLAKVFWAEESKVHKTMLLVVLVIMAIGIFGIGMMGMLLSQYDDLPPVIIEGIGENGNSNILLYNIQDDNQTEEILTDIYMNSAGLNPQNKEELLLEDTGYGYIIYNYIKDESRELFSYEELDILDESLWIEEFRFIPESEDISFSFGNKIYIYNQCEKTFLEIYEFDKTGFEKLGYPFEWKNQKQIYVIENDDLILYDIETEEKQTIFQDIGKVYFNISTDNSFLVYQNQRGKNRDIMLLDLRTMEQRKIHTSKYSYVVRVAFSPDEEYIFLQDYDYTWEKHYWYIYDIPRDKKQRVRLDQEYVFLIGW